MENNIEYPIIKKSVDNSLENVSSTLSLFDTSEVSFGTLYDSFSSQVAGLIANGIEISSAEKFHESLKWYGKLGFVSKERVEQFEKNITLKKGIATSMAYVILDIAPSVFGFVASKRNIHNFQKFYISWLAYINKESNTRIEKNVAKLFNSYKIRDYKDLFQEFGAENVRIVDLPSLNKSNYIKFNAYEVEQMKIFAGNVLRACDLCDEGVRERAEEFLDVCCKLSAFDIDRVISNTKGQVDFLSNFIVFNAITGKDIFESLFNSVKKGEAYAIYNIDNDPYRKIRQNRVMLINKGIKLAGAEVHRLAPEFKLLEVFADMSAEIIGNCMDIPPSMKKAIKIGEVRDTLKGEINCARRRHGKLQQ